MITDTNIVAAREVPTVSYRGQQATRPWTRAAAVDNRYGLHKYLDALRSGEEASTMGRGEYHG